MNLFDMVDVDTENDVKNQANMLKTESSQIIS